jgi:hypothetical protein
MEKPTGNQITLNEPTTIKYRIKDDKRDIVTDFAIAHEKIMHFIVVRKDLTQFQHLHPDFNQETGEFSVAVTFPAAGPYRFFADSLTSFVLRAERQCEGLKRWVLRLRCLLATARQWQRR